MEQLHCPKCNKLLDAHKQFDKGPFGPPRIGDLSVCAYCASILVFDEPMPSLRVITKDEIDKMDVEMAMTLFVIISKIDDRQQSIHARN